MADAELSTLNDDSSCEEVNFDKETPQENIRSFNNDSSSSGSYCSIDSALITEEKNDTAFEGSNDSSWISNPMQIESLKNEGGNCDSQEKKSVDISEDLSRCSVTFHKEEEMQIESLKNEGGNCDSQEKKSVDISEDLSRCSVTFHKEEEKEPTAEKNMENLPNSPTIETDMMPVSTCFEHTLPITLYCNECHVCLCVACCERHRYGNEQKKMMTCPSPIFLDVIATEKRTQGLVLLESLASYKEQSMKQSAFIDTLMSELSEKSERKCESLWNELEVLFTALRHRLALLISQLQTETHSQKSKLERKSLTWNSYMQKVDSVHSKLSDILQDANNVDLVSAFKDIKSKTDSLDIDKFVNMMEMGPISVDVEYSQEYSNLHRNVSEFVIGKPLLTFADATGDYDIQQTLSGQSSIECTTDKGTKRDVRVSDPMHMQQTLISDPFLIDEGSLEYLNMADDSNLRCSSKSFPSPALRINIGKTSLKSDYKNSFTTNSSTSSFQSSLTTFSDVSSLQSDFDNGTPATQNVCSPTQAFSTGFDPMVEKGRNNSFPEYAAGSLESEFFPRQMPILKASCQWSLILEKNTYVRGLTVTEDDHVFVCDRSSKKVTQFNPDGKLMSRCDVSGIPWDVCASSNSVLFVTLPQKSKILLLQRCTGKCLLAVSLAVSTGAKKYVSLTKVSNGVLACDHDANVDILDSNANVMSTILSSIDKTDTNVSHRICSGKFDDIFWMLNISLKTISCNRMDGELLIYHRIAFEENTSDICADRYNCIYGCDKKRIYSLTSEGGENILWTFKQELKNHPRMCVNSARDKLFVSYQFDNKNILRVFTISPKFLLVNN